MCPEEETYLAHRQGNPLLGLPSAFGASIAASMATAYGCAGISSGRISTGVWQLRTKIACHREDEVGIGAVHLGPIFLDHFHRDVGPAFDKFRTSAGHAAVLDNLQFLTQRRERYVLSRPNIVNILWALRRTAQ
jgi:hypothetical protein